MLRPFPLFATPIPPAAGLTYDPSRGLPEIDPRWFCPPDTMSPDRPGLAGSLTATLLLIGSFHLPLLLGQNSRRSRSHRARRTLTSHPLPMLGWCNRTRSLVFYLCTHLSIISSFLLLFYPPRPRPPPVRGPSLGIIQSL